MGGIKVGQHTVSNKWVEFADEHQPETASLFDVQSKEKHNNQVDVQIASPRSKFVSQNSKQALPPHQTSSYHRNNSKMENLLVKSQEISSPVRIARENQNTIPESQQSRGAPIMINAAKMLRRSHPSRTSGAFNSRSG